MYRYSWLTAMLGASLVACASTPSFDPSKSSVQSGAAPQTQVASPAPAAQPSTLSYGSVTTLVQRNRTTQLEILQNFGGPNIATTDSDGTEVWVYDRAVTETDIATQSKAFQGAVNLGVSFGLPHFGSSMGASGGLSGASGQASTTSATRTLTVIVKFNSDKTVKDYAVRSSTF